MATLSLFGSLGAAKVTCPESLNGRQMVMLAARASSRRSSSHKYYVGLPPNRRLPNSKMPENPHCQGSSVTLYTRNSD
jgi:hypothetical protein